MITNYKQQNFKNDIQKVYVIEITTASNNRQRKLTQCQTIKLPFT